MSTTLLASSLHGAFGVNPEFRVQVNRDVNGNWEILCDSTGGTNFTYELGATDVNHTFSNFTGLWSKHTSSNNDNIFFDDISINGNIASIIGNICMDMCMVDVTDLECSEGDEVIVFETNEQLMDLSKAMPPKSLVELGPKKGSMI